MRSNLFSGRPTRRRRGRFNRSAGFWTAEPLEPRTLLAVVPPAQDFLVNTTTQGTQWRPAVAADPTGDFVVAWASSDGQDGDGSGIYGRRFNAAGQPQGGEFLVNTTTRRSQYNPAVAIDAAGDFVIAWQSNLQDGNGYGVYAQRYNAAGVPQGTEFIANTTTTGDQASPSVGMDPAGNFVIAWSSGSPNIGVYAQRFNAGGQFRDVEFRVNTTTTNGQAEPSVAVDAAGAFVVAWSSIPPNASVYAVFAQPFSAAGQKQGAEISINTAASLDPRPSVAVDGAGDFVVAWSSADGSAYGIYAQRYNAAAVAQGNPFRVNTATYGYQTRPSVSADADGDFVIAWEDGNQDGDSYGIYAQRFDAAGVAQEAGDLRVNTVTAGDQRDASVAVSGAGRFVVAWTSSGQDGSSFGVYARGFAPPVPFHTAGSEFRVNTTTSGDQYLGGVGADAGGDFVVAYRSFSSDPGVLNDVFIQRYTATGTPIGTETRVNTHTGGNQFPSAVAAGANGDFVVVWDTDQDGAGVEVYARRFNAAGVPQGDEFRVNTFTTGDQFAGAVAADADGDFVVTWSSLRDPAGDVYAQRFSAAGLPQGGEFRVNTTASGKQTRASVAMEPDGDFVVVWEGNGPGDSYGIFAQRYTAAGAPLGAEFPANAPNPTGQARSSVATGADGHFVVAWQSLGQDGSEYGVFARVFDGNGAAQGSEFQVNTTTSATQGGGDVALDADGEFTIFWEGNGVGDDSGVFFQRYSAAGLPQGGESRVNTYTANLQYNPLVAGDAGGDLVVVWQSQYQDGSGMGVYAQRYATRDTTGPVVTGVSINGGIREAGVQLPAPVTQASVGFSELLSTSGGADGADSVTNPANWRLTRNGLGGSISIDAVSFISDASGGQYLATVTFPSLAVGGSYVLTAKSSIRDAAGNALDGDADGQAGGDFVFPFGVYAPTRGVGSRFQVDPRAGFTVSQGVVATDADGDFVVAWTDDGRDGSGKGVYAQQYNAAGAPRGAAFLVNTTTAGNQSQPSVAIDADGDFVVVWTSAGQEGPTEGNGVYGQRFSAAGERLGGEFHVNEGTFGNQDEPSVAADADGGFVVAWASVVATRRIYARRYDAAGVARGGEFPVGPSVPGLQYDPSTAADAAGDFVVTWTDNRLDGTGSGVWAQRFNVAGERQGEEFRIGDPQINQLFSDAGFSSVAIDADGDCVVAWMRHSYDSVALYAQRFDAEGAALGGEITLAPSNSFSPSVTMDADGDFVVAWIGYTPTPGVFVQSYNAASDRLGGTFILGGSFVMPSVSADAKGDFVVAWTASSLNAIFAQRFEVQSETAAPIVTGVTMSGRPVMPGASVLPRVTEIRVNFSEAMSTATDTVSSTAGVLSTTSVTSPASWRLTQDGRDVSQLIESITFGVNPATNKYEAVLKIRDSLRVSGNYTLTARGTLHDPAGNRLDGDRNGHPGGGDYVFPFKLANDPPASRGIDDVFVVEDEPETVINLFDVFADATLSPAELSYDLLSNNNPDLFESTAIDPVTGTLTLRYASDMNGQATLVVRAVDDGANSAFAQFTVNVRPAADLTGTVFNDVNSDGTRNPTETGVPGWTVFLDVDRDGTLNDGSSRRVSSQEERPRIPPATKSAPGELTSVLRFPNGIVADVNVSVDLTADNVGDLAAYLVSPGGRRVRLFAALPAGRGGLRATTFDDQAAQNIHAGSSPFTGSFRPDEPLSAFNFSFAAGPWTLDIVNDGAGTGTLNGWSLTITPQAETSTVTDAHGNYFFSNVPAGFYTVAEVPRPGWAQTAPAGGAGWTASVLNGEDATDLNFGVHSAAPVLSINDVRVTEGDAGTVAASFTVSLSAAATAPVTVNWSTADGRATAGDGDYQPASGILTFAPGATSQTVTVVVNGDTQLEPNETFLVNLSDAAGAAAARGVGFGTIVNDDAAGPPPAVTGVFVAGTTWTPAFRNFLQAKGSGDSRFGYALPAGAAQLAVLPWVNLNQFSVRFTKDVLVLGSDASLRGSSAGATVGTGAAEYVVSSFDYDDVSHTATWTFDRAIPADKLLFKLLAAPGGVVDANSVALDGEWNSGGDAFPSGDGAAGGDFRFRANVLPGDANRNGKATILDWMQERMRLGRSASATGTGALAYDALYDLNGDGRINDADLTLVRNNLLRSLPATEPASGAVAPVPATATVPAVKSALTVLAVRRARVAAWSATGDLFSVVPLGG
jgi:subtilisin-like proprotein convertase family protein